MNNKKTTIIGAGNIGTALLGGICKANLSPRQNLTITDVRQEHLKKVGDKWNVATSLENRSAVQNADVVILCVKPQTIQVVLGEIGPTLKHEQLVISVAAGIATASIATSIKKENPIVRAMPNIPALVGEAATAICLGKHANAEHQAIASTIFSAVGEVVIVDESLMDAVTGLSGSGPAYIYMIIEALTDGGVKMGLSREVAIKLATQTILGSAKLVKETGVHPAILKEQVTTPGGTAIAAIHELEIHGLRPMLISAVVTATEKSRELSQLLSNNEGN